MQTDMQDDRITGGENVVDPQGNKLGKVAYVVVQPPEMHLTDIVVSTGALLGRDVVVPMDDVSGMSDGKVHLTIDKEKLGAYKEYVEVHFEQPPENWAPDAGFLYPSQSVLWPAGSSTPQPTSTTINAPAGTVGIHHGMTVTSSDGHKVGSVHAIDAGQDSGDLTDFIVRHGLLSEHEARIPISNIASITGDGVKLAITRDEVEQFEG